MPIPSICMVYKKPLINKPSQASTTYYICSILNFATVLVRVMSKGFGLLE